MWKSVNPWIFHLFWGNTWICEVHRILLSCVQLFVTLLTVAHQAPLYMEFSSQEYRSGLPCPPPGDLPNPGIEPRSPTLQAESLLSEPPGKPKNTTVGSLSLFQGIFLTQELSWGLLHCRQDSLPAELLPGSPLKVCIHVCVYTYNFFIVW